MHAARIPLTLVLMALCQTLAGAQDAESTRKRVEKLLVDIQKVDGRQSIRSINSKILIQMDAIDKIVAGGPAMLDDLVLAMK